MGLPNGKPFAFGNGFDATHEKILTAIVAHRPAQAAQIMRNHIRKSEAMWQAVVSLGGVAQNGLPAKQ